MVRVSAAAEEMVAPPLRVARPFTVRVLSVDVLATVREPLAPVTDRAPVTVTNDEDRPSKPVEPDTPSVELCIWTPFMSTNLPVACVVTVMEPSAFVIPATALVRVIAVAEGMDAPAVSVARPVTPSVPLNVVMHALATVSAPVTVTNDEDRPSKPVEPDTPSDELCIWTPFTSTHLPVPVDSETMACEDVKVTAPVEPVADKVRGPVEVEIVLLDEPVSINVADVVVPEAPMYVTVVAPVPSSTAPFAVRAPVAVRAPFTVVPVEDERVIRFVASVTPIDELCICTPLISTYLPIVGVEKVM